MKKYGMILLMLLGLTVMLTACGGKKKAESPEVQKGIDRMVWKIQCGKNSSFDALLPAQKCFSV